MNRQQPTQLFTLFPVFWALVRRGPVLWRGQGTRRFATWAGLWLSIGLGAGLLAGCGGTPSSIADANTNEVAISGINGSDAATTQTTVTESAATETAASETLTVIVLPAIQQQDGSLAVRVLDGNNDPVTDATVRLEGDMNHAGMIPVISDPVEHEADGVYRVPFEFTMLGDWIISVYITAADGTEHATQIELAVREEGIVLE